MQVERVEAPNNKMKYMVLLMADEDEEIIVKGFVRLTALVGAAALRVPRASRPYTA